MTKSIEKYMREITIISSVIGIYCFVFSGLMEFSLLIYPGIFFSFPYMLLRKRRFSYLFDKDYFILSITFILTCVLNLLVTSNSLGGLFVLIANLCLTIFILENSKRVHSHAKLIAIITLTYIAFKLFYLGTPPHEFYENFSRNIPGYFLVVFTIFYLFISHINNKKFSLFIPIIAFIISIFLIGRSSLGVLLVLLLISILYYLKRISKFLAFSLFILLMFIVENLAANIEIVKLYLETGFAKKGLESSRYDIWVSYFHNFTFIDFILGRDPHSVFIINMHDGNLHNSFMKFHSRMGIGFFIFMMYYFKSIYKYIIFKEYYLFFILILLSIRLFFDSMNFISQFDFIFFSLMFYSLKNKDYNAKYG